MIHSERKIENTKCPYKTINRRYLVVPNETIFNINHILIIEMFAKYCLIIYFNKTIVPNYLMSIVLQRFFKLRLSSSWTNFVNKYVIASYFFAIKTDEVIPYVYGYEAFPTFCDWRLDNTDITMKKICGMLCHRRNK